MSAKRISSEILSKVDSVINKYNLFPSKKVAVAYSGGKDSLFLCLCLKELGFDVLPIIIDIGYKNNWAVAIDNLNNNGMKAYLLEPESYTDISLETEAKIKEFFESIVDIKAGKYQKVSPCTPCYNAKLLLLIEWAKKNEINQVAFGHHGTDALSSMLKSYFMYYDRWRANNPEYDSARFIKIIREHALIFQADKHTFENSRFYFDLKEQVNRQNVGTDEAILQDVDASLKICRPLYAIMESDILSYYNKQNLVFNNTECFYKNLRDGKSFTPREMVQQILLSNANSDILSLLMNLNYQTLDNTGRLLFRVRNNRDKILGSSYKTDNINAIKL